MIKNFKPLFEFPKPEFKPLLPEVLKQIKQHKGKK